MTRAVRWLVVALATAATFGVCVWVVRAVPWGWLPQGEGPRLDTALTFGAVTAAAVLAAGGWWASRELTQPTPTPAPTPAPQRVRKQQATASGKAQVTLVGGSRDLAPSTGPQPPGTPPPALPPPTPRPASIRTPRRPTIRASSWSAATWARHPMPLPTASPQRSNSARRRPVRGAS